MTYKLHKNGIVTGSLNSFCLACDQFLNSQEVAADHIGTSKHKKRLLAVQYSDKFQDEHIRKFKGGYYCEFCNVLMQIASKVNLHITDNEHKHKKGILLLKPVGSDVVAFNNIVIEAKAWHGLIEGVCSLCNAEFDDEKEHKADARHSLNLILKPIQFGPDNAIFRDLDDTAVQCLTCNKLLAPARMTSHFDEKEHHKLYAQRRIETNVAYQGIEAKGTSQGIDVKGNGEGVEAKGNSQGVEAKENCEGFKTKENCQTKATNMSSATMNDVEPNKSKINNDQNKCVKSLTNNKSKILEFIGKYQSKGININLETDTAFCKKCSKVITFDHMDIENHIQNHSSATAVDSDLLYPTTLDRELNRVDIKDINDTTKKTSDEDTKKNKVVEDKTLEINQIEKDAINEDQDSSSSSNSIPPVANFETLSQEEEARDFAKENKITFNGGTNKSFCRLCTVEVPASFRSMKEHVEGANHKRLATSAVSKPKTPKILVKVSTSDYVDLAYDIQGILYTASIVNEEFCIPKTSFHFISECGTRLRCVLCEVNLPPCSGYDRHCRSSTHVPKWLEVPVIISEKNEYIREMRPGLFHCGYCHLIVSGWADMKQHLDCFEHKNNRSVWESRLRFHLPSLRRYKALKEFEAMKRMNYLNGLDDDDSM